MKFNNPLDHCPQHDLECFLQPLRGQTVLFAPNLGNAGDSVIACAEYQMFDRLGIDYKVLPLDASPDETRGRVVLYGGGGNLVSPYQNAKRFIALHHRGAARFIVLPHTVRAYADLIESLGVNVDLICRERESYEFAIRAARGANVHLMNDVALSLNISDLERSAGIVLDSWRQRPGRQCKRMLRSCYYRLRGLGKQAELFAFRGDAESSGKNVHMKGNIDLSQVFCGDDMTRLDATMTTFVMLKFIDRYSVVHTDRLHVCISSLLLGKTVMFHDNSYGKNRSVYHHSLKGRFPLLHWQGE